MRSPRATAYRRSPPFRIVNISNSRQVQLNAFIAAIEAALDREAIRNELSMQPGEVPATRADAALLYLLTGYRLQTEIRDGIASFVGWF